MKQKNVLSRLLLFSVFILLVLVGTVIFTQKQNTPVEVVQFETFEEALPEHIVDEVYSEPDTATASSRSEASDINKEPEAFVTVESQMPARSERFTVCIDPGHFKDSSVLEGENLYGYGEGIFTIQIALKLQEELQKYGIDSYLTRETDNILMSGFYNEELDSRHISLRGEFAKNADLFVSLHTNANSEHANGFPTCNQPKEINKTVLIMNQIGCKDEKWIHIANEIGKAVTNVNYNDGISYTNDFKEVSSENIKEWTTDFNDSLYTPGSVYIRTGKKGDFYGVLRGATAVNVPGIIIEHGFHTVEEVRQLAMMEHLADEWAKADAYGIAKGLGFIDDN